MCACVFADSGTRWRRCAQADQGLGLSHREMVGDDPAVGLDAALGVGQAEQGPGMPLGDFVGAHRVQDRVGQLEEADQVGHGRAVEPEPASQLFLGATVARQVFAECSRLVDRIQVFALQVFDHRQLEDALIVEDEDPCGHLVELGLDAGAQAAFTGDELIAIARPLAPRPAGACRAAAASRPVRRFPAR